MVVSYWDITGDDFPSAVKLDLEIFNIRLQFLQLITILPAFTCRLKTENYVLFV